MHGMWIILTNRSCWVTTQQWWNFFSISLFYVQFSRKLYTPKDNEEDVHQEVNVLFSAEKDSELKCGLSANVRGKSSNRYVGGMMFLLSSASLYTVISHALQELRESDHRVLVKTALCKLLVKKVEFCEHRICLLILFLCFKCVYGHQTLPHCLGIRCSHLPQWSSLIHCVAILQDLAIFFPLMYLIIFNYRQKCDVQYCVGWGFTVLVSG
jgi:hypothetical protein